MTTLLVILALITILYYLILNLIGLYLSIFKSKLMRETVSKQNPDTKYSTAIIHALWQAIGFGYAFYYILTTYWF